MNKSKINSPELASRMGAYSHGYRIETSDAVIIFTTGQIAMDAEGKVLYPDDPAKQAEFIYRSLDRILRQAGSGLADVVKMTVYVTNMDDFPVISAVRNRFLKDSEPVSTLVEVNRLVKDGCRVEIEAIAVTNRNQR